MVRRDKFGSEAETGRKRRRNRYGLHTGSSGSTQERDWVVGSQILTIIQSQVLLEWNARETEDQRGPDGWSLERTLMALRRHKSEET